MMRIKIFSDFCDSNICKMLYEYCNKANTLDFYGEVSDKKVFIVDDDCNDYTHAILLNKAMPSSSELTISKNNVIGIAFDSIYFLNIDKNFVNYVEKNVGKYYIGDKKGLPDVFIEAFPYIFFNHPSVEIKEKNMIMSLILDSKKSSGQQYSNSIADIILLNNIPIDIYGDIPSKHENSQSDLIKGAYKGTEPYNNYAFTIAIENFESNMCFTDKVISPLMCDCIPIYYGCKNITNNIGNNVIMLSGNLKNDMNTIVDVLKHPDAYYKDINKDLILNKVSLLKNLENLF